MPLFDIDATGPLKKAPSYVACNHLIIDPAKGGIHLCLLNDDGEGVRADVFLSRENALLIAAGMKKEVTNG